MESDIDFAGLVDCHYGSLYRFALSLTRKEVDAGDLVQDVFHTWAQKGQQLQDPTKAKPWLFTTLHRKFLERQRRIVRFPEVELGMAEPELPTLTLAMVERLDGQRAVELLGEIDEPFRAPVALFYLEDFSHPEIARLLGIPLGTVKSRIARGMAQLRRLVADFEPKNRTPEHRNP